MLPHADLAIYNRDGQLTGIVEIKNKLGTSREWAAKLRRNILAHGGFRNIDFFLLVTPDHLYLWKSAGVEPKAVRPTYEIDARPVLEPYFKRAAVDPSTISGGAFELVVAAWLADLVRSKRTSEKLGEERSWLVESGLLAAIRNGRVAYEAAA
jgi:hypothetical protein